MPELPEVQTVVTTLTPRLRGKRIRSVEHLRPDIVKPPRIDLPGQLVGRSVRSVDRRAKRIVITLDDENRFYIHLGMTGRLTVEPAGTPVAPHTHLILSIGEAQLRFRDPRRFGGVFWLGQTNGDERIGPEPLTLRPRQLASLLSRTSRAIKTALLDQALIAGLGNIYVDEALFHAGIGPLQPAKTLSADQVLRLNRAIKLVLRRAIKARGSSFRDYVDADGQPGAAQTLHRVYGREGHPCPHCRTPIQRIVLSARSTHFCPTCQP